MVDKAQVLADFGIDVRKDVVALEVSAAEEEVVAATRAQQRLEDTTVRARQAEAAKLKQAEDSEAKAARVQAKAAAKAAKEEADRVLAQKLEDESACKVGSIHNQIAFV